MHKRVLTSVVGIAVSSILLVGCGGSSKKTDSPDGLGIGAAELSSGSGDDTSSGNDTDNATGNVNEESNSTVDSTEVNANVDVAIDDTEVAAVVDSTVDANASGQVIPDIDSTDSNVADVTDGTAESKAIIEPPAGYAGQIEAVVTPGESDPFSKFQLDDTLYTNNVYDGRQLDASNGWELIYYDDVQDFVRWEVPALLGTDPSPCARPQAAEPLSLTYKLTSRKDSPSERNTFVRAYPAMVVGTMGGRYESWGFECGQLDSILPLVKRHGGSPVFQMEDVAEATGLPVRAGDLDYDIRVSVKADLKSDAASTGIANLFMDSYWHNVSDVAIVPDSTVVDTINGISSDYTEVWNLNIWFDYPRFEGQASSWTGGFKIATLSLDEGGDFDVYFKIEGSRDGHIPKCRLGTEENCFLYIGLVTTDIDAARNGITVNYTEISNWLKSAEFRDLFLTGAFESGTPSAKAYEAWRLIDGTDNDDSADPAKRGPRFPDKNHVIGGIHLGSELWYNPDAEEASIVFDTLGVEVEGIGQFGRYVKY